MAVKSKILPYLALGTGILSLGFSALFVRWAAAPGPVMGFFRIGLATLILAPAFARQAQRTHLKLSPILIFPVLGGILTGFDHAIFNTAIHYTTAANATLLNNTAPLWVSLVAWVFFRERLHGLFWLGLVLAMSGGMAVMGSDFLLHPSLGWGDLLALVSSLFYAGYFLVTERGREKLGTLVYIWIVDLVATLSLLGISLGLDQPLTGYSTQTYLIFLGAAVVSQIGGYFSVAYALGHLPASVVSPTMIMQPMVTALLALPLLGERPHLAQVAGGLIVLAGIFLVHRSRQARPQASPAPRLLKGSAGRVRP